MLFFGVFLRETARPVAKSRTNVAQIQEKLPNGWTDWYQIWHTCADSLHRRFIWEWIYVPQYTRGISGGGGLGGHKSKSLGGCQTAGPIGTTFGRRLRIRLRMGIG